MNKKPVTKYLLDTEVPAWEKIKKLIDDLTPLVERDVDNTVEVISLLMQRILEKEIQPLSVIEFEFDGETLSFMLYDCKKDETDNGKGSRIKYSFNTKQLMINGWIPCAWCGETVCNPVDVGDGQRDPETYEQICSKCLDKQLQAKRVEMIGGEYWHTVR